MILESSNAKINKLIALRLAVEPVLRIAYSIVKTFAFSEFTQNNNLWNAYLDLRLYSDTMSLSNIASKDFKWIRRIGVGGYGSVFACVKKDTGILYAIKRMSKKSIKRQNAVRLVSSG